jgi:hypothetical protein
MQPSQDKYDHIIVTIHGIGDQTHNETVRSVVTRLARIEKLAFDEDLGMPQTLVAPQPLGFFYSDFGELGVVSPVDREVTPGCALAKIGFSEVYWADVPQKAVDDRHTMDESKAWARTVTSRARAAYLRALRHESAGPERAVNQPDFTLAAEVLDEIIDTIYVLESLCFLARKAGLFDFNLRKILDEFVGDVQIVTEFTLFRHSIIGRFHEALERINRDHPNASLYIVAHSEGTVVSFVGLLEAIFGRTWKQDLNCTELAPRLVHDHPIWLKQVKGYMTIGSPLDKHIVLWPALFEDYCSVPAQSQVSNGQIKWRNYYDYGDPVGFMLDTTRQWLEENRINAFEFDECHDIGFARYLLPGKAHNDYWDDSAVFEHFVSEVIPGSGVVADPPRTRGLVRVASPSLPYVASFLVLFSGTLVLYKAVAQTMHAPLDSVQRYVHWKVLGSYPEPGGGNWSLLCEALGVTLLIAGTTLFARLPRLSKLCRWWWWGATAFAVGCAGYVALVTRATRADIGSIFGRLQQLGWPSVAPMAWLRPLYWVWHAIGGLETWCTILTALVVAWIGRWGIKEPRAPGEKRRMRWFRKQMRPLLVSGGLVLATLVGYLMTHPAEPLSAKERSNIVTEFSVQRHAVKSRTTTPSVSTPNVDPVAEARVKELSELLQAHPPVWPVVLAAAAFMYLWWLAALIFDLAFVWQRYIRRAVMLEKLKEWRKGRPANGQ